MNLERPLGEVPLISVKNFCFLKEETKIKLINDLLESKKIHDSDPESGEATASFLIRSDPDETIRKIYDQFYRLCEYIFGKFTLSEKHDFRCCALMTNNEYWKFNPHNHIETSTINGVYYVNIPKINDNYCGRFMVQFENLWYSYQPEPFELLIMPNFLVHDIAHHDSNEWRVSLNMEITTKETLKELVNRQ